MTKNCVLATHSGADSWSNCAKFGKSMNVGMMIALDKMNIFRVGAIAKTLPNGRGGHFKITSQVFGQF